MREIDFGGFFLTEFC